MTKKLVKLTEEESLSMTKVGTPIDLPIYHRRGVLFMSLGDCEAREKAIIEEDTPKDIDATSYHVVDRRGIGPDGDLSEDHLVTIQYYK